MATIETVSGKIEGREGDVHAFLGIPYAAPPIGARRFRPPARPAPWSGVRPATTFGPVVPQPRIPSSLGALFAPHGAPGDDCLNLNVWTPAPGRAGLPVLVWIHGGAFQIGAGSEPYYDGTAFARHGVVLVSINYRLGAQGFLHPDGVEGAGNFGMLDQIRALKWVRENIRAFGGDPANVTIAGESAGGMSVGTLLAMPDARGLFRGAIAQSGAGHNGVSAAAASAATDCMAEALGVDPGDVDAWRAVPVDRLLAAEVDLCARSGARAEPRLAELAASSLPGMVFQPVYGTRALPIRPIDAVRAGSAKDVDLLVGSTAEEMIPLLRAAPESFGVAPGDDLPAAVVEMVAGSIFGAAASRAIATYHANRRDASNLEILGALHTDWLFGIPATRLAEAQSSHRPARVYLVTWQRGAERGWGAGHALDIPIVFDSCETDLGRHLTGGRTPRELVDAMHGAWVAFATRGDPSHGGLPAWPTYDLERRATLCFDAPCTLVDDPSGRERRLWEGML